MKINRIFGVLTCPRITIEILQRLKFLILFTSCKNRSDYIREDNCNANQAKQMGFFDTIILLLYHYYLIGLFFLLIFNSRRWIREKRVIVASEMSEKLLSFATWKLSTHITEWENDTKREKKKNMIQRPWIPLVIIFTDKRTQRTTNRINSY